MVRCHPFFLLLVISLSFNYQTQAASGITPQLRAAYSEIVKLKLDSGRRLVQKELQQNPGNLAALLVANYPDFLELVISQDETKYKSLIGAQQNRLEQIEGSPEKSPYKLYGQAEIKIQLAACQFFFDDEIKAAWNIRQAFLLLEQNQKKYPDFYPNRKSLGILQFAIGSIPDSYKWILSLLGMKANVKTGINNLKLATENDHPFQTEAALLYYYLLDMLHQESEAPMQYFVRLAGKNPDNLFFQFMAVSVLQKRKKCDTALSFFQKCPTGKAYLPVIFMHHMAADMLLFKGDYEQSLRENQYFLNHYRGKHYVKDAYYKMYLAAWLDGQATLGKTYLPEIGRKGTDFVEEDQIALKYYRQPTPINSSIMKARLHTDGGYYEAAGRALNNLKISQLNNSKDKIEYYYRLARLYHGQYKLDSARKFYLKTMAESGNLPYYFAPNAALQLGYLAMAEKDKKEAKKYFQKALAYPKHEYKRSIDSKAKVALGNL